MTGTTDPDSAPAGPAEAPRGKGPTDGSPPPALQGTRLARITSVVLAGLASQAVILTAVLFYFGWARAKATYGYFGVDISVLDFSAPDYVLRSVSAAFPLLVAIGLAGLAAMIVHERLRPRPGGRAGTADRLARAATWAGGGLVAAGLALAVALTGPGGSDFPGPAVLLIGCALIVYGVAIRIRYGSRDEPRDEFRFLVAMTMMAAVALLWTVTAYADYVGIQVAKQIRAGLPAAAEVTVYSAADLSISGPGISPSRITIPDAEYRFRYSGLRILISSGGHYFLARISAPVLRPQG